MMDDIPIWYVVMVQDRSQSQLMMWHILHAIPCKLGETNAMYKLYAAPLYPSMPGVQSMIFSREVPNPVNTFNEKPPLLELKEGFQGIQEDKPVSVWDI